MGLIDRLQHGWNAFINNKDPTASYNYGMSYSTRPDRVRLARTNERTIMASIISRIGIDAAQIDIKHVKLDENDRYIETVDSGLNYCLNTEANIDQTGRAFKQDIYMSLMDEGFIAIVPIDTTINPKISGSYDIKTMRVGKIIQWYPKHVKVEVYNELIGKKQDVIFPKETVAIIENPLYSIMNETNSTLQRLKKTLSLLDIADNRVAANKLDLIVQLPYSVKSSARQKQAEERLQNVEKQLTKSPHGIAYIDSTEHITQLNRPIDNQLQQRVEYLTSMLYSQLGITQEVLAGTADEKTMLNYFNRSVEPIVAAVADEIKRKFLTKTARSQKQSILMFRDPFKLVPVSQIAEIADKFTRNEIMSKNEIRQVIGMKPSDDPKADQLINSNIAQSSQQIEQYPTNNGDYEETNYEEGG